MSWGVDILGKAIYYQLRNLCSGRVYPVVAPQGADFPFLVYRIISVVPENTKQTASVVDTTRLEVVIIDNTYNKVGELASVVRDQLDYIQGTYAGVNIDGLRFDGESDQPYDTTGVYQKNIDFLIRVKNAEENNSMENIEGYTGKTANFTATDVVPSGYMVQYIFIENSTANEGQLSCGTSSGGSNVFAGEYINESGLTTIKVEKTFSTSDFTSLYFNTSSDGDTWNSMTLNIYIILKKVK